MEECYFRLKPATLLKVSLLHGCFLRFLNSTNGTNSRKASHFILCHEFLGEGTKIFRMWIVRKVIKAEEM